MEGMNKNIGTLMLRLGVCKLTGFRWAAMVVLKQWGIGKQMFKKMGAVL
jgi:hypothetical protein